MGLLPTQPAIPSQQPSSPSPAHHASSSLVHIAIPSKEKGKKRLLRVLYICLVAVSFVHNFFRESDVVQCILKAIFTVALVKQATVNTLVFNIIFSSFLPAPSSSRSTPFDVVLHRSTKVKSGLEFVQFDFDKKCVLRRL